MVWKSSAGTLERGQYIVNVESVNKKLTALEEALQEMVALRSKYFSAFEKVGRCYVDVTRTTTVQSRGEGDNADGGEMSGLKGSLFNTAKLFELEMRDMKDGNALPEYRTAIHKKIIQPIQPLRESAKKTVAAGKAAQSFLKEYQKKSQVVEKKIQKYAKANKPLTESKLYSKQVAERDSAHARSQAKTTYFTKLYDDFLKQMEQTTGETLDSFLDTECCMLERTIGVVREVASHATQRYPSISKVLVKSTRHSVTMRAADNSPPTKTSRINPVDESVETQPNGDATPAPCVGQEPFNDATAPENPLFHNFAGVELSVSKTANSDLNHSHESHHPVPEQWEVRAPDTDDVEKSGDGAQCPSSRREPFGDAAEKDSLNHPKADQVDAGSTAPDGCGVNQKGLKEEPSLVQTKEHSLDAVEVRLRRESSCSLDRSVGPLNDTVAASVSYQVNAKVHSGSRAEDAVLQHSSV